MSIPIKSLQNGFTLLVLGSGTWQIGGKFTHDSNNNSDANITAIQQAVATEIVRK